MGPSIQVQPKSWRFHDRRICRSPYSNHCPRRHQYPKPKPTAHLAAQGLDRMPSRSDEFPYFTFKLIHYAIEVSRGRIAPHPLHIARLYLIFFAILPAGPIERFDHFVASGNVGI